jgi:hypothetical protein
MPSFSAQPVGFTPPEGWHATNPSIARSGEQTVILQRCVNYTLTDDGEYKTADGSPIATRNFLLHLNPDLRIGSSTEVLPPVDPPRPAFDLVLGFEDARPFVWRGDLWCSAKVRQLTPEGWCDQVLARIDCPPSGVRRLTDWYILTPEGPRQHEMNWIPVAEGDDLRFVTSCDPVRVVNDKARTVTETMSPLATELFPGGSQGIAFDRGWLALVHEASESGGRQSYWHRFVWFDAEFALHGVSRRFYLQQPGVESAAGLAWHPDGERLLISFGVKDCEAWFATVEAEEVRAILLDTLTLHPTRPGKATAWQRIPPPAPVSADTLRAPMLETAA